ncbi:hypothetical protein BC831DRAFT_81887 [Entophlyctis helioformis]|nr:hypothetical protein BC831DRAFT_81887 [Entophlyctis helioformis]
MNEPSPLPPAFQVHQRRVRSHATFAPAAAAGAAGGGRSVAALQGISASARSYQCQPPASAEPTSRSIVSQRLPDHRMQATSASAMAVKTAKTGVAAGRRHGVLRDKTNVPAASQRQPTFAPASTAAAASKRPSVAPPTTPESRWQRMHATPVSSSALSTPTPLASHAHPTASTSRLHLPPAIPESRSGTKASLQPVARVDLPSDDGTIVAAGEAAGEDELGGSQPSPLTRIFLDIRAFDAEQSTAKPTRPQAELHADDDATSVPSWSGSDGEPSMLTVGQFLSFALEDGLDDVADQGCGQIVDGADCAQDEDELTSAAFPATFAMKAAGGGQAGTTLGHRPRGSPGRTHGKSGKDQQQLQQHEAADAQPRRAGLGTGIKGQTGIY